MYLPEHNSVIYSMFISEYLIRVTSYSCSTQYQYCDILKY